nr:MAG TPA: hypothetical protein [Caudoviricetes sp.]
MRLVCGRRKELNCHRPGPSSCCGVGRFSEQGTLEVLAEVTNKKQTLSLHPGPDSPSGFLSTS